MTVVENCPENNAVYLDTYSTFLWWKKRQVQTYCKLGIGAIVAEGIMFPLMMFDPTGTSKMSDFLFGIVVMIGLLCLIVYSFMKAGWFKTVEAKRAFYGVVSEKNRFSKSTVVERRKNREHFIVAKVGKQLIEGRCEEKTFRQLDIGDAVIVFNIDEKQYYAIHCG